MGSNNNDRYSQRPGSCWLGYDREYGLFKYPVEFREVSPRSLVAWIEDASGMGVRFQKARSGGRGWKGRESSEDRKGSIVTALMPLFLPITPAHTMTLLMAAQEAVAWFRATTLPSSFLDTFSVEAHQRHCLGSPISTTSGSIPPSLEQLFYVSEKFIDPRWMP